MAAVRACRCSSDCTRPVSWLEPAWCGTHPRTKGTRCFAGGYRRRIPSTPKGLLASRADKPSGDPSKPTGHNRRSQTAGGLEAIVEEQPSHACRRLSLEGMHAQLQTDRAFGSTPEGWGFEYRQP